MAAVTDLTCPDCRNHHGVCEPGCVTFAGRVPNSPADRQEAGGTSYLIVGVLDNPVKSWNQSLLQVQAAGVAGDLRFG